MEVKKIDETFLKFVKFVRLLFGLDQTSMVAFLIIILASLLMTVGFFYLLLAALVPPLDPGLFCGIVFVYYIKEGCTWITPSPYFWFLFLAVFVLLMSAFAYSIFAFFLVTKDGPALLFPPIIVPSTFIIMDLGIGAAAVWLFMIDQSVLGASMAANIFILLMLMIPFGITAFAYERYKGQLHANARFFESAMVLIGFLNGLAGMIAAMVYLAFVNFRYLVDFGDDLYTSDVVITAALVSLTIYFIMDISVLERWTRFVISPYIVFAVAGIAAVDQLYKKSCGPADFGGFKGNSSGVNETMVGGTPDPFYTLSRDILLMIFSCSLAFLVVKTVNSFYNSLQVQGPETKASVTKSSGKKPSYERTVPDMGFYCDGSSNKASLYKGIKIRSLKSLDSEDADTKPLTA